MESTKCYFEKYGMTENSGTLTQEQISKVKGFGCLRDKRYPDVFNVRVITRNGKITTDEQRAIAKAADLFGDGHVAMTTRLTIEIQGVKYNNIPNLMNFLEENGLETGGTGPKVRPIVSCKGTTCVFGLIDTFSLSEQIHQRFYKGYHDVVLPHKFKIAVGGCPNNCVKPDLNDIGIIGQRFVEIDYDKCRGCKKCTIESSCPMKAAKVLDGKITVSDSICNNCGRCYLKCPFGAFGNGKEGYKIFIGGRWGKKTAKGQPVNYFFQNENDVLDAIERGIILFRDEGIKGERFADTVSRLGFDYVEEKLLKGLDK